MSRRKKVQPKPESQIGKKFGNLTVTGKVTTRNYRELWCLKCDCGQVVFLDSLHTARSSVRTCLQCNYDGQKHWLKDEIAECNSELLPIPIGAQVVVVKQLDDSSNPHLVVEFTGKNFQCRASALTSLGVTF